MEKEQVKEVLKELRNEGKIIFSSHDFIKKFAETYERDYITMLWEKRNNEHPFQTVHSQIGLELERMQNEVVAGTGGSRRDRYLGMTAAIPQVPVPTAMNPHGYERCHCP